MKYLKRYNEDIEWEFEDEEKSPIEFSDLTNYFIEYKMKDECINIMDKLSDTNKRNGR